MKGFRRGAACILAVLFMAFWPGNILQAGAWEALESEVLVSQETEALAEGTEHPEEGGRRIYLDIDSCYAYEGMEQSFSEGYRPEVKNGNLYLAIPFTASGNLAAGRLTVSLEFPEAASSPFLVKNYQKTVEKKRYALKDGKMVPLGNAGEGMQESGGETEAYLYCMEIPLSREAAAGQYVVVVRAFGYTEQMEQVVFSRRIFISLPGTEGAGSQEEKGGAGAGNPGGTGKDETGNQAGTEDDNGKAPEDGLAGEEKNPDEGAGENAAGGSGGAEIYREGSRSAEELVRPPRLLLEEDGLSEGEFAAGSEAGLIITLKNYSEVQPLYNLKVTISAENPGVQFSKNSFYVQAAAPGEAVFLETTVRIAPDAADGAGALVLEMEYEDKKGNALSGRETAVLSVRQPAKVEFSSGEFPGFLYASDTLELSFRACNVGRTQVFNVRASLSADGLCPDGEVFLGNLEAGAEGEGIMRIYAGVREGGAGSGLGTADGENYGPVSGNLTFQYEDSEGNLYEETKPFRTEIKKAQIVSFAVDEPEETNSWGVSVAAAAFAGLLLWILLLLGRLRRKNRLLEEAAFGEKSK